MSKLLFTNHTHKTGLREKKKLDKQSFIPKCMFMKRLIVVHITGSRLKRYHFYEIWGGKVCLFTKAWKIAYKIKRPL